MGLYMVFYQQGLDLCMGLYKAVYSQLRIALSALPEKNRAFRAELSLSEACLLVLRVSGLSRASGLQLQDSGFMVCSSLSECV